MTFKVEFTPEADADLDRLFDFLLERAETVEEALRTYDASQPVKLFGTMFNSSPNPTRTGC